MRRFPLECNSASRLNVPKRRFSDIINELELRDLPPGGGPFTWCGGQKKKSLCLD